MAGETAVMEVAAGVVLGDGLQGTLEGEARVTGELRSRPVALEPGLDLRERHFDGVHVVPKFIREKRRGGGLNEQ
jgi:hypothetical protein